jgi:flagellum-specific peptidoglycan hydrolase FlgJ
MSKVKEDTAKVDNTAVVKPKVFERLRVTPRKYELVDLGGTPSNDTRTPAERNKDYLHPIKGAKERFKASMSNETNPLVGIERTILPSAAGAALVTTPIALAKGAGYGFGIDKLTGGWGNMVERTTGIPSEIAQYTNPGAIIGGAAGYRLDQKNLLSKFIKGDAEFMVFRNPGTNYVGPIDDVGGHVIKLQMDKGKLKQTSQDMWKFNPADYAKRWNESPNAPDQVRLTKQAALMDKVGTPFILQQSNPIWIEGRSVRQAMKVGGKFTFKKSPAVKDAEKLNGKRDMRKKFVKSSRPTYKRRIRKGQVGMRFVSYVPVNNPTIDYTDITNPINPFSEYYIPTTYNTEQALVVPEREDSKSDTVEETPAVASKPIAEPVVNKPVASKVVVDNTANSTWSSPYKDRSKWMADLTNAYKRAGITNDNAIRMLVSQDALESAWGRSAQGKFNFGNLTTGAKWKGDYVTGNDKNAKGEAIKQKFRSYNSMDEYAADKVQFLKRLYDFDENDDINKFVAKLTGSNKGKRRYAEARNYADTLKKVYNSYRSGGIIKYQNPAQPIKYMGGYDKRGNMVLPVTNENGMNNVTRQK